MKQESLGSIALVVNLLNNWKFVTESEAKGMARLLTDVIRREQIVDAFGKTRFNIYNFVADKTSLRASLRGVFHEDGKRIATDNCILLVLNNQTYDKELEGQTLLKDGSLVSDCKFPNWRSVIPNNEYIKQNYKQVRIDIDSYREWLKEKRIEYAATHGKKVRFTDEWAVCIDNTCFRCERFDKTVQAIEFLKSDTLWVGRDRAIMTNENGTIFTMGMIREYADQIEPADMYEIVTA